MNSILSQSELPSINLLNSVYCFIAYISKSIVKPKLVHKTLTEAGLDAERTESFVNLWKSFAPLIVDRLKKASFKHSSEQLQDIHWKVKLLSEQSFDSHQKLPLAELNFVFQSPHTSFTSDLSLTFTHQEIKELYENLETIQSTIDRLHQ